MPENYGGTVRVFLFVIGIFLLCFAYYDFEKPEEYTPEPEPPLFYLEEFIND